MCCCGQPTINGELGYRWQPNDAPSIRPVYAPDIEPDETLLYDEAGRCGGVDSHCHHYRVTRQHGGLFLLVRHGGGDERIRISSTLKEPLAALDSTSRYWFLSAIMSAHSEGARNAERAENMRWRIAAAEKRIKTRKQRGGAGVKVWIEEARS